jgi:hypothetical protein
MKYRSVGSKYMRFMTTNNHGASFDDARSNASNHAADHGQHVECSTPSAATAAEG